MSKKKQIKKNQPKPLPCTDTGNMERFIRDHRHVIKSGGHDRQWYIWTGQRWKPSPRDAAFNLALKTVENIGLEAARPQRLQRRRSFGGGTSHPRVKPRPPPC